MYSPKLLRHLTNLHIKDNCTIICLAKNCNQLTTDGKDSLQTVNIDMAPYNGTNLSKMQNVLKKQSRCAIFVYEGERIDWLLKLRSLIMPVENSAVLYSGSHEPERDILWELNKPVIWASTDKKVCIFISIYKI